MVGGKAWHGSPMHDLAAWDLLYPPSLYNISDVRRRYRKHWVVGMFLEWRHEF